MDIQDILALDKASRKQVNDARAKADAIDNQTPEKINQLRTRLENKTREELDRFEQEQKKLAEQRVTQIEEQLKEVHARLDEKYAGNKKEWISHIVKRVTEV